MSDRIADDTRIKAARSAGLLYLLTAFFGAFSIMVVEPKLYVPGDGAATVARVLAHEGLFRLGVASGLVSAVLFLVMAHALYTLLKAVDGDLARLMLMFVVVSIPAGLNFHEFAPIVLSKGAAYRSAFEPAQVQALSMAYLELQKNGGSIGQVFWGLWLVPLGLLVMKSGFIPKGLGVLLVVGGLGYIVNSLAFLLLPGFSAMTYPAALFGFAAELSFMSWLIVKGARRSPATSSAAT